jgi:cell division topological specificity factor
MSLLSFFLGEKKKTAAVAKDRLSFILALERVGRNAGEPDHLMELQRDLIDVIRKYYVKIDPNEIKVNLERRQDMDLLEVKIELPDTPEPNADQATA